MKPLIVFILFCIFSTLTSCSDAKTFPIPEGTHKRFYGNITSGSEFGISIGMSKSDAKEILSLKFRYDGDQQACTRYAERLIDCNEKDNLNHSSYRVKQFGRDGQILVFHSAGKVHRIVWNFTFFENLIF